MSQIIAGISSLLTRRGVVEIARTTLAPRRVDVLDVTLYQGKPTAFIEKHDLDLLRTVSQGYHVVDTPSNDTHDDD